MGLVRLNCRWGGLVVAQILQQRAQQIANAGSSSRPVAIDRFACLMRERLLSDDVAARKRSSSPRTKSASLASPRRAMPGRAITRRDLWMRRY